jgi:hypothetical protein
MLHRFNLDVNFATPKHMETFEIQIKGETFKVTFDSPKSSMFNVFNHSTFHTLKRNDYGEWEIIEHRFGKDNLPLDQIGEAIDRYYTSWPEKAFGLLT